jgi:hypothetical protein
MNVERDLCNVLVMGCRVYWHNAATDALELLVAKSPNVANARKSSAASKAWRAAIIREALVLNCLEGVSGVVAFRGLVPDPNGGLHLIMEYVPFCLPDCLDCAFYMLLLHIDHAGGVWIPASS